MKELPPGMANLKEYLQIVQKLYDRLGITYHSYADAHTLTALDAVMRCVERVLEGKLTEEEFQNLCHNLTTEDRKRFEQGCKEFQEKLFGKEEKSES